MTEREEQAIVVLNTLYDNPLLSDIYRQALEVGIIAIKALDQRLCEYKEYEKDLNELKEEILEEGNILVSKRDLLERFVKIDNDYSNRPWNLLQILANINILIGKEPCSDYISREDALMALTGEWIEPTDELIHRFIRRIRKLPPVTVEPKTDTLDKIKAEIEAKCCITVGRENDGAITLHDVFEIIDKYKAEGSKA